MSHIDLYRNWSAFGCRLSPIIDRRIQPARVSTQEPAPHPGRGSQDASHQLLKHCCLPFSVCPSAFYHSPYMAPATKSTFRSLYKGVTALRAGTTCPHHSMDTEARHGPSYLVSVSWWDAGFSCPHPALPPGPPPLTSNVTGVPLRLRRCSGPTDLRHLFQPLPRSHIYTLIFLSVVRVRESITHKSTNAPFLAPHRLSLMGKSGFCAPTN